VGSSTPVTTAAVPKNCTLPPTVKKRCSRARSATEISSPITNSSSTTPISASSSISCTLRTRPSSSGPASTPPTSTAPCKFIAAGDGGEPFASPAIHLVPPDWRAGLPGQVMMAVHAVLTDAAEAAVDHETVSARHFGGNTLVGSEIDGGLPVKPDLATGASIPLLAGVVALGVRRIRKAVSAGAHA
jgi:hypothetical protein